MAGSIKKCYGQVTRVLNARHWLHLQQHTEVPSQVYAASPPAWHPASRHVKAHGHSTALSEWSCTQESRQIIQLSCTESPKHLQSTPCTTAPTQHVQPWGFFCCRYSLP